MAARRLLIVMLILLGISTLAAALVPQHGLRRTNGTSSTTTTTATQTAPTTTTAPAGAFFPIVLKVGGEHVVVDCSPANRRRGRCQPIHVGDQLSVSVYSNHPTQLSVPEYGLFGFASQNTPAMFELIVNSPKNIGILFEPSEKVAAQIRVMKRKAKSRARGGSGPA